MVYSLKKGSPYYNVNVMAPERSRWAGLFLTASLRTGLFRRAYVISYRDETSEASLRQLGARSVAAQQSLHLHKTTMSTVLSKRIGGPILSGATHRRFISVKVMCPKPGIQTIPLSVPYTDFIVAIAWITGSKEGW